MPEIIDPWRGTFEGIQDFTKTLRNIRLEQKEEKRFEEERTLKVQAGKREEKRIGLTERGVDVAEKRETRLAGEAETREETVKWQTLISLMGQADKSGGDEGARATVDAYWKFAGFDKMEGMPKDIKYQGKRGGEWNFRTEGGKLIAVDEAKLQSTGGDLAAATRTYRVGKTTAQKIKETEDKAYSKKKGTLKAEKEFGLKEKTIKIGEVAERVLRKVRAEQPLTTGDKKILRRALEKEARTSLNSSLEFQTATTAERKIMMQEELKNIAEIIGIDISLLEKKPKPEGRVKPAEGGGFVYQ